MTSEASPLGLFFYRSLAADWLRPSDTEAILNRSWRNNLELGLTGCLHFEDGLFFQWLEGPSAAVDSTRAKIMADPRHHAITVLSDGPLVGRSFDRWSMRFSDRRSGSVMDWLAQTATGPGRPQDYAREVAVFLQQIAA